jgi:hypothetical protein
MAPPENSTWLRSDRFLARSVARPVNRFLHIEASGGLLLVAAAVTALVWANSPWSASYRDLWATDLTVNLGGHAITENLRHWINRRALGGSKQRRRHSICVQCDAVGRCAPWHLPQSPDNSCGPDRGCRSSSTVPFFRHAAIVASTDQFGEGPGAGGPDQTFPKVLAISLAASPRVRSDRSIFRRNLPRYRFALLAREPFPRRTHGFFWALTLHTAHAGWCGSQADITGQLAPCRAWRATGASSRPSPWHTRPL